MAILPNDGRTAIAEQLARATMHVAWGEGETWWGAPGRDTVTLDETGRAALPIAPLASATVTSAAGATTYTSGVDYALSPLGGEIVRLPLGTIPEGATLLVEYVAGRRPFDGTETALIAEVGRRKANSVVFVEPSGTGDIETPDNKRWQVADAPTRHLYVSVNFGFSEAATATIREVAIFINTVAAAAVPPGQLYLTPDEISDPGRLLLIDRLPPIIRTPAETRSFSYVITI